MPGDDQPTGEALRFLEAMGQAAEEQPLFDPLLAVLDLKFDDGRRAVAHDIEVLPVVLLDSLQSYYEIPHTGYLHALAGVQNVTPEFDLRIAYQDIDGPLEIRFDDDTGFLADQLPVHSNERIHDRWTASAGLGLVQQSMEEIVTLSERAGLLDALNQSERKVAEALLSLLSQLSATPNPPKAPVREAVSWLGRKVDLFIDEAAKAGGKVVGVAAVGGAIIALDHFSPQLSEKLHRLWEIAQ